MRKIEAFAMRQYTKLDYSHGTNHAFRTVALAEYLALREGADVETCRAAALLHQYHPEHAEKVDRFLRRIRLSQTVRDRIVHCVRTVSRSSVNKARTVEARVVFDADKLQVLGPFGAIREIAYRTRTQNLNYYDAAMQTKELQRDIFNRLQTKTARRLARRPHALSLAMFKAFEEWSRAGFTKRPLTRTELRT